MKVKLGGKEYDVDDKVGKAIKDMGAKMKDMEDENDELADAIDAALGEKSDMPDFMKKKQKDSDDDNNDAVIAELEAQRDAALDELAKYDDIADKVDEDDNFKSKLKEHNKASLLAQKVLKKDELKKLDDMELSEIKEAVIRADSKDVDAEKLKNENYVNARFDLVAEKYAKADSVKKDVGKDIVKNKADRTDKSDRNDVAEDARAKSISAYQEAMQKRMDKLAEEDDAA